MKRPPAEPCFTAALSWRSQHLTRREVLTGGLAVATAAAWAPALGLSSRGQEATPPFAVPLPLLLDGTIAMPHWAVGHFQSRLSATPILHVALDADGFVALRRFLDTHTAVAGISSGATLFCLERIAWDHGFRLTHRQQQPVDGKGKIVEKIASRVRDYRPSRTDGLLHHWVMRKSGVPSLPQAPREV